MYILFIVLGIFIIIYLISFFIVLNSHNKRFKNRFTPDPNITYYNEKEFNCLRQDDSFKIKNITLKGCFITPNFNYCDDKIIIYCHGLDSPKEAYMQDISFIANAGFKVFCFDYIGVNESEGKSVSGFSAGLKSVDYAIKHIHNKYPNKDIYVIGHSWGSWCTINSVKYNPYVKKICCISPFIKINDVAAQLLNIKFKLIRFNAEIVEFFKYGKYAFANSIKTLKKFNGKGLIIHSKDDFVIPYNISTKRIKDAFKDDNRYKFVIVDGKKHNPQYTYDAIRKTDEVLKKFSELKKEEIPSFMQSINFHELGELDIDIMNQIVSFFKE